MTIPQFTLAVVGAPYDNKDGSNREFEIRLASPGDPVELRPEPKNKYDEHAVAVISKSGTQIGYVTSERAPHIGVLLRAGHVLSAIFQERTQWGCLVRVAADGVPLLQVQRPTPPTPPAEADYDPGFDPDWIPPDE